MQLLDLARLHAGQSLSLDLRSTDMVALATRVARTYQQSTTQHRIHVESAATDVVGLWDTVRLERVLGNLLSNAIKYSPAGGSIVVTVGREAPAPDSLMPRQLKRFQADGLDGLRDAPRPGRPATYTVEEVGEVIATALTNPQHLDLPFASWTLDRLEAYLNEEKGIPIKRSRIDELLIEEGLRWRSHETWFGERVDPAFAEKRVHMAVSSPAPRGAGLRAAGS